MPGKFPAMFKIRKCSRRVPNKIQQYSESVLREIQYLMNPLLNPVNGYDYTTCAIAKSGCFVAGTA